jgi:hypothetical protein
MQGYFHPKLEVLRLTCLGRDSKFEPWPPGPKWEASTLAKSYSNSGYSDFADFLGGSPRITYS